MEKGKPIQFDKGKYEGLTGWLDQKSKIKKKNVSFEVSLQSWMMMMR
jgi:hypothetical protein